MTTHSTLIPDPSDNLRKLDTFYICMVSSLVNCIALYVQMDSITGRTILNCCSCYNIILDNILELNFQLLDIYSCFHSNVDNSVPNSELLCTKLDTPLVPSLCLHRICCTMCVHNACTALACVHSSLLAWSWRRFCCPRLFIYRSNVKQCCSLLLSITEC